MRKPTNILRAEENKKNDTMMSGKSDGGASAGDSDDRDDSEDKTCQKRKKTEDKGTSAIVHKDGVVR
jgi:hypothetical protein